MSAVSGQTLRPARASWALGVLAAGAVSAAVLFGAALFVADRLCAKEPLWFAQWVAVVVCPYVLCAVPILWPSQRPRDRRFVRWATVSVMLSQVPAMWYAVGDVRRFDGQSPAMIGFAFVACYALFFLQYPLALAALATTARRVNSTIARVPR